MLLIQSIKVSCPIAAQLKTMFNNSLLFQLPATPRERLKTQLRSSAGGNLIRDEKETNNATC